MVEELSNLSHKAGGVHGVKNEILIIQVTDSSDLKCVKEEINIVNPI